MRKSIIALWIMLCLAVGFNPGAAIGGSAKDPRLVQRVTYQVKLRPVADLTSDLTQLTHVTFMAGRSASDWRVREDCATVMAKDIRLAALMDSIAHALKCRWVRSGAAPNWSYRLTEDPVAIAAIKKTRDAKKRQYAEKNQRSWDLSMAATTMSDKELSKIRDTDPWIYLAAKAGALRPAMDFLQQVPEAREAFLAGEQLKIAGCWLTPEARRVALKMALASVQMDVQLLARDQRSKDQDARIAQLDKQADQMIVDINGPSFCIEVGGIYTGQNLESSDSEYTKVDGLVRVQAYEQKRPRRELRDKMQPLYKAAAKKDMDRYRASRPPIGCDPGMTHPADSVMVEPLKDNAESNVITGMVASFADASGFAVVTADIRGRNRLSLAKGTPTREALDKIAPGWYCNWNRNGRVLEIWHADWYDRRMSRVSKIWLESMRKRLRDNGTLDIDDLGQIASLTDAQLGRVLQDDDLECIWNSRFWENREFFQLYATLSSDQRSDLFSDSGLYFADLTSDQQQVIMKRLKGTYVPVLPSLDMASLGARIYIGKEKRGKAWLYTISARTNIAPIPGQYHFGTPAYVPPPPPKDFKPQPAAVPAATGK